MAFRIAPALFGSATLALIAASPALAAPSVVATIKPLHSLVAGVMDGVGTPELLVEGAASPHGFSLRPSDAGKLEGADIVFWIGQDLETFLTGPLATLAADARVVEMMDVDGIEVAALREGGLFEVHAHDDHGDDAHDDHGHGHDDHGHDDHGHDDHDHEDDHGHDHDDHGHDDDHDHAHDDHDHEHEHDHAEHDHAHGDAHIWLDPRNARLMVAVIADTLMEADPENAEAYNANGAALAARLSELETEIEQTLADVERSPYFVFHDAYQVFENRFDLPATGSFTVNPEVAPGAKRLTEIRAVVEDNDAVCIFSEPQFSPQVIETIADGTGARTGELDPLGANIEDGPELYFTLMRDLAASFAECLEQ
jgi:zinc transport system substrate-binding protein